MNNQPDRLSTHPTCPRPHYPASLSHTDLTSFLRLIGPGSGLSSLSCPMPRQPSQHPRLPSLPPSWRPDPQGARTLPAWLAPVWFYAGCELAPVGLPALTGLTVKAMRSGPGEGVLWLPIVPRIYKGNRHTGDLVGKQPGFSKTLLTL